MAEPYIRCPICGGQNHPGASACATCGTALDAVEHSQEGARGPDARLQYDYRYGETDLFESDLNPVGRAYLLGGTLTLLLVALVLFVMTVGYKWFQGGSAQNTDQAGNETDSPRPTLHLATVTPAPPTLTFTVTLTLTATQAASPTPAPCTQKVAPGDDLITLAYRCGHRSLDVIDLILELNDLSDAALVQAGQTIIIPWPTPTDDPNTTLTTLPEPDTGLTAEPDSTAEAIPAATEAATFDPFGPPPTKTLQPGVAWHRVRLGETISGIAFQYGANVEILSQLNPEVTFSQCDFSSDYGGDSCIVQLYEGQLLRVPAPTPTPTVPPTASGSETPTPTATATFNAPSALSPDDKAFFRREELVTLRWVATGTLAPGQSYVVQVTNLTTGEIFMGETDELFLLIPTDWQGKENQRYEYQWTVSVVDDQNPGQAYYTTQPRTFIWEGG